METLSAIKHFFLKRRILLIILGAAIGAIGGYLYYYYIGCSSGSCPITSNPYVSMIWGAAMGALLFTSDKKRNK